MSTGYDYTRASLMEQLTKLSFPEHSPKSNALIADWLFRHLGEYDRYSFNVRVGQGIAPDPTHDKGVQTSTAFSSKKKIDILAWQGDQPFIFEVKLLLIPAALGQLQTYQHLWMEENPNAKVPYLGAIARTSDADTNRVLQAHGVTIYLIPATTRDSGAAASGVPADNSPAVSG